MLWNATRVLQERAVTLEQLAADARSIGAIQDSVDYDKRAAATREQVQLVRTFTVDLLGRSP